MSAGMARDADEIRLARLNGDYCWKRVCVDMLPLQRRRGLPRFDVLRGRMVRVHLGFAARARSIEVALDNSTGLNVRRTEIRATLDAMRRILSWNATRGGILVVSAHSGGRAGGASYVARLVVDRGPRFVSPGAAGPRISSSAFDRCCSLNSPRPPSAGERLCIHARPPQRGATYPRSIYWRR